MADWSGKPGQSYPPKNPRSGCRRNQRPNHLIRTLLYLLSSKIQDFFEYVTDGVRHSKLMTLIKPRHHGEQRGESPLVDIRSNCVGMRVRNNVTPCRWSSRATRIRETGSRRGKAYLGSPGFFPPPGDASLTPTDYHGPDDLG
jgi:hypothetical protein